MVPVLRDLASPGLDEAVAWLGGRYIAPIMGIAGVVARKGDVDRAMRTVVERFGKVNVLMNNATLTGNG